MVVGLSNLKKKNDNYLKLNNVTFVVNFQLLSLIKKDDSKFRFVKVLDKNPWETSKNFHLNRLDSPSDISEIEFEKFLFQV